MSSLYRSVIARARAKALAARLSENYESAAPTHNAGAAGAGRVRIGNQIYDATTTQTAGAVAVKNAGRPGAAIYAPTIASGATVTRSSGGSTGSTVATYHNQLLGLTTGDDHPHYLNIYRGDARYVLNERMIIAWAPLVTTPTDGRLDSDVQIALDLADDSGLLGDATGLRLGTPGTLSVSSAAAVTSSSHTHPITASSAPGAAAALLKSGADGRLTLVGLAATAELSAPKLQTASGDLYLAPASGKTGVGTATPAEALDVAGKVKAQTAVQTPQIETASGNLAIAPAGTLAILASGKGVRSYSFASGFTGNGWQIDDGITVTGRTTAEVDDLTVRGRMRIYELLIHQIRATNGSVFVSSTGKAKTVTAAGGASYTITTETDHGFANGDIIRAQRFTGTGVYQCDMTVTAVGSTTQFTATLRTGYDTPAINMEFVRLGNTSDTSRQGAIYMTADDSGAPYLDVVDGIAAFTDWNTAGKIKTRLGKLTGITGRSNEYGLAAGNGFAASDAHVIMSDQAAEIHNIPIRAYSGATQTAEIDAAGRLRIGTNIANANTTLIDAYPGAGTVQIGNATSGAAVTVYGAINVAEGGNAATFDNITGAQNLVRNSSFELDSNADGLADGFTIYNGGNAQPTTASRVAGEKSTWAQRIAWTGTNTTTKGIYFGSTSTKRANIDYVLTFWARTNTAVNLGFYEDAPASTQTALIWPQATTTWQFYARRLRWASTPAANFFLSIQNAAAITNGWIEFDNVQVIEGSAIVPYAPALTDLISYGGAVQMPAAPSAAGLYATASYLGYYNGSAWRSYIDSSGNFYFAGNSGARLEYNASAGKLRGVDSSGNDQWYANASSGLVQVAGNTKSAITEPAATPILPVIQQRFSLYDRADAANWGYYDPSGGVQYDYYYPGMEWMRLYVSSQHYVQTQPYTTTITDNYHVYDAVIEMPANTFTDRAGEITRRRLMLKAPEITIDGPLTTTGAIAASGNITATGAAYVGANVIYHAGSRSVSGNRWDMLPWIDASGVMEIGAYLDFHESDADTVESGAVIAGVGGVLYTTSGMAAGAGLSGVGLVTAAGSSAGLRTQIRDDTGKSFIWYATSAALRAWHSVNGDLLRITDAGRLMVGNTTDLYTAKIQTSGGIAAGDWIHTDTFFQGKGGGNPTSHVDYFQIYMTQDVPAEGKRTVWVKCRNTTNTGDYSAVIARNYTP